VNQNVAINYFIYIVLRTKNDGKGQIMAECTQTPAYKAQLALRTGYRDTVDMLDSAGWSHADFAAQFGKCNQRGAEFLEVAGAE
jgi:hypothetical protein